jgi:hypothetical protein
MRAAMSRLKRVLLLLLVAVAMAFQAAQLAAHGICVELGQDGAPAHVADHDHAPASSTDADPAAGDFTQGDAHSCGGAASIASSITPTAPLKAGALLRVEYAPAFAGIHPGVLDRPPLAL